MGKAAEAIITCIKGKNMTQRQLAEQMGEDVRMLNQQLHRQKDLKVERFIDVLEHIGYRLEIVDNDGILKVSKEFGEKIVETKKPLGLFWYTDGDKAIGVYNSHGMGDKAEFASKEDCFRWLKV